MPYTHIVVRKSGYVAGWFDGEPPDGFVEECNANVPGDPAHAEELDGDEAWAGLLDTDHCGLDNPHPPHVITGTAAWCAGTTLDDYAAGEPGFCGSKIKHPPHDECPGLYEDRPCPACGCEGNH